MIESGRILSGTWRFRSNVDEEALVTAAKEFAAGPDGDKFLDLHIRRASDCEFYIGFKYLMDDSDKKTHDECFHKMRQRLKRRFGDDLKGWSISHPTRIVKWVNLLITS